MASLRDTVKAVSYTHLHVYKRQPLPHVPGAAPKSDTGKPERVMQHIDAAHTRKASKKAEMCIRDSNLHSAIFSLAAYTVILCFSLFKTGALDVYKRQNPSYQRAYGSRRGNAAGTGMQDKTGRYFLYQVYRSCPGTTRSTIFIIVSPTFYDWIQHHNQ